ncbi:MAG TPA: cytochrome c biogenesis protein CcdA, partial [Actinomycetales bacterium]|nr:cytochrome c biogenesis protein CcdA [Actinomycetales bacterium]
MGDFSFVAAFVTGILSLLSPCSALLLPSFFAYAFASRRELVARTAVFTLGLALVLMPLGMGIQAISAAFIQNRSLLITIAGWMIIAFGVVIALGGGFRLPGGDRLNQSSGSLTRGQSRRGILGWLATLALGSVYGFAGFCAGPALGAILTIAATSSSPFSGAALMGFYALGMAAPLFVLALLWERFRLGEKKWLRGRTITLGPLRLHSTSLIAGAFFVLIGVLFLVFDGTAGIFALDFTEASFAAQQWVVSTLGTTPIWVYPLIVAAIAFGWYGWSNSRARRAAE